MSACFDLGDSCKRSRRARAQLHCKRLVQNPNLGDLRSSLKVMFVPETRNCQALIPRRVSVGQASERKGVAQVYILTELITGGELHGAIREIPTVLSRPVVNLCQRLV